MPSREFARSMIAEHIRPHLQQHLRFRAENGKWYEVPWEITAYEIGDADDGVLVECIEVKRIPGGFEKVD